MTKDYWRIIPESVFVHVKVRATHTAKTYLNFDLIVSTAGLLHLPQLDIPKTALIFDESFHVNSPGLLDRIRNAEIAGIAGLRSVNHFPVFTCNQDDFRVVMQFDKREVGGQYRTERGSAGSYTQVRIMIIRGIHRVFKVDFSIRRYRARFCKATPCQPSPN